MTSVLLAEDDESISEPLSRALRREGYQVDVTADGPSTLERALSDGIDLIVLGISPDPPAKLARFRDAQGLHFPLLSDVDRSVLTAYGAYGEKQMYGRTVTGVIRSTFVIDPQGRIDKALYNVRATGHVAKLRKALGV